MKIVHPKRKRNDNNRSRYKNPNAQLPRPKLFEIHAKQRGRKAQRDEDGSEECEPPHALGIVDNLGRLEENLTADYRLDALLARRRYTPRILLQREKIAVEQTRRLIRLRALRCVAGSWPIDVGAGGQEGDGLSGPGGVLVDKTLHVAQIRDGVGVLRPTGQFARQQGTQHVQELDFGEGGELEELGEGVESIVKHDSAVECRAVAERQEAGVLACFPSVRRGGGRGIGGLVGLEGYVGSVLDYGVEVRFP